MQKLKYLAAVAIGVLPVHGFMIWYRLNAGGVFTLREMLVYPLAFGGGSILLMLVLNSLLLGRTIRAFNPGKGLWYTDAAFGLLLAALCYILLFLERPVLSAILPPDRPPSREIIDLITGLVKDPLLLALWLGPVVWIGVAAFEELSRVFFLQCLWKLLPGPGWAVLSIALVSVFAGAVHLYQGAFGLISVSIQGLLFGFFFYRFGRIWPLIIAHALYDSVQIVIFAAGLS
ncbi:MAG TPA: CPBP family intramembrane metalloprotease [Bacteroidales bacterium]|nr:CPBP family intramembrane metalloprotease [Bacteroidales bacterium]